MGKIFELYVAEIKCRLETRRSSLSLESRLSQITKIHEKYALKWHLLSINMY